MSAVRSLTPYHHYDWTPPIFKVADSYTDLMPVAAEIVRRIGRIRKSEGVGAFVFGNLQGEIRVIKQGITADRYCDAHPDELVGLHAADRRDGKRTAIPTVETIFGDLRAHFVDIGFISDEELIRRVIEGLE